MKDVLSLIPRTGSLQSARDFFDRFFDDEFLTLRGEKSLAPAFDISESEKAYTVTAELPGIDEKDLEVTIAGGMLSVKGEKKQESEEKGGTYHRIERTYGSFHRSFRIPDAVQEDKVDATYKNGILKLVIPKAKESSVKKIAIKK
ncbi:MAG: Hsp20/alpha crystallin family protein [Deltaproteobacteria bacterium]|nr:Hsp20/alpha crystallin family protein [Deltaproteobacteria bacterium]